MPLDVLGGTRTTLTLVIGFSIERFSIFLKVEVIQTKRRDRNRKLQMFFSNEEFLVDASHQGALTTSLLFVHTARRFYRLDSPVIPIDSFFDLKKKKKKLLKPYCLEEKEVVTRFP